MLRWLETHHVRWRSTPIAYCKVTSADECRYLGQLATSVALVPDLLSDAPHAAQLVCTSVPCECGLAPCGGTPPLALHPGQTQEDKASDPNFCQLRQAVCKRKGLSCLADGSAVQDGMRLAATVLCSWHGQELKQSIDELRLDAADTCGAIELLQSVQDGSLDRRELELVVAQIDEDISWSAPYAAVRTIYTKGTLDEAAIKLPNVGREQHSYLEHLVRHYDDLAERTVFMHGREPLCGFFLSSGERGGHLNAGVSVHDYMASKDADVLMPRCR